METLRLHLLEANDVAIAVEEIILGIITILGIIIVNHEWLFLDYYCLPEASGRSRRHGAKKSGSTVLLRVHSIGVD